MRIIDPIEVGYIGSNLTEPSNFTLPNGTLVPVLPWTNQTAYNRVNINGEIRTPSFVTTDENRLFQYVGPDTSVKGTEAPNPEDDYQATIGPNRDYFDSPDPLRWQYIRQTNPRLMLDRRPSLQTVGNMDVDDGAIIIRLSTTTSFSSMAFIGLEATSVEWSFVNQGRRYEGVNNFHDIESITNAYDYHFKPLDPTSVFTFRNIPRFVHPSVNIPVENQLTITIRNGKAPARCGQLILGSEIVFGVVDARTIKDELVPFTFLERDRYGVVDPVSRASTTQNRFRIVFDRNRRQFLKDYVNKRSHGEPLLISLDEDETTGTTILGFISGFNTDVIAQSADLASAAVTIDGFV